MPTYLIHGFRWHRPSIRIHIVVHDLEDAAPEWIVAPASSITILNSFYTLYDFLPPSEAPSKLLNSPKDDSSGVGGSPGRPSTATKSSDQSQPTKKRRKPKFNEWSSVKILEQYDPEDLSITSQPYAYIADYMVDVRLSADIAGEIASYEERAKTELAILGLHSPSTPLQATGSSPSSSGEPQSLEGERQTKDLENNIAAPAAWLGENLSPSEKLSARDVRRRSKRHGWLEKLRDQLQKDESTGWYVVVCGDEDRATGLEDSDESDEDDDSETGQTDDGDYNAAEVVRKPQKEKPKPPPKAGSLRNFISRKMSIRHMRSTSGTTTSTT